MGSLNVQFIGSYKLLDSLLKDMYQSEKGISDYINDMAEIKNGSAFVDDWDLNLEQLKRLRHIRNRLCHEVGSFEENLCNESDIRWLNNFRESLINQTDPLFLYKKRTKTIKVKSVADPNRQLPQTPKFSQKALLFGMLALIPFVVIFSLVLIYFIYYK